MFSCCALLYEPEAFFPALSLQAQWWGLWFTQAGSCAASWTPPIQSTRYSNVRRSPPSHKKKPKQTFDHLFRGFIDCVFCSCSGSDHTNKTLLDMNDSSGENILAAPSKTQLNLFIDTFGAGKVSWFTCRSQSRCEGDVCLLRGGGLTLTSGQTFSISTAVEK